MPLFRPEAVICHGGYDARRYSAGREAWLEHSAGIWRWFSEQVRESGSVLRLENVYEKGPGEMRRLLDLLKGTPTGFCLDTGHLTAFGQASLTDWLEVLGPRIAHIHLHDNHGERDEHLAPGRGRIDFVLLFQWLKTHLAVPPRITLEPHREQDLEPAIRFLEQTWPW